jgi:DNA polymerase-3 subunit alpha
MEKEMTGLYLSGHPMDKYEEYIEKAGCAKTFEIIEAGSAGADYKDGSGVTLCGIISHITIKQTRANKANMAFVTLEDLYGTVEVILFPKIFAQYASMISEGNVIAVSGTLSIEEEKEVKILANAVYKPGSIPERKNAPSEAVPEEKPKSKRNGLFLKFASAGDERIEKAKVVTTIFEGDMPLYFYFEDEKKYHLQKRSDFVDVNETMLAELKRILGDSNVAVIY